MTMDYNNNGRLPPGTQRIEDQAGSKILLAPQPNADPNQPLVRTYTQQQNPKKHKSKALTILLAVELASLTLHLQ